MNSKEMKLILRDYEKNLELIKNRIGTLKKEALDTDEIIRTISLQIHQNGEEYCGEKNAEYKQLVDILLRQEKTQRDYILQVNEEIQRLFHRMDVMRSVYKCYMQLPDDEFEIITHLYINHESIQAYSYHSRIATTTMKRKIKDAFKHMEAIYNGWDEG